jgi:hypothetical protein
MIRKLADDDVKIQTSFVSCIEIRARIIPFSANFPLDLRIIRIL